MEFDLTKYPRYLADDLRDIEEAHRKGLTDLQGLDCIEDSLATSLKVAVMGGDISRAEAYRILEKYPVLDRLGC